MKSVMTHKFNQIPRAEIPRSTFDRSHGHKTTFDAGYLIPYMIDEMLPGDTFKCRRTIFARLATPIYPIMDNLFLEDWHFFVPARLLWDNWQRFNGEQTNPDDSIDYLIPSIAAMRLPDNPLHTIWDYLGIPIYTSNPSLSHSYGDGDLNALPLRAYNLIWNEWFRDENLQESLSVPKGDGPDDPGLYTLKRRGKRHDYFTSCLPWPQKGPGVELPLAGATVTGSISIAASTNSSGNTDWLKFGASDAGGATGSGQDYYAWIDSNSGTYLGARNGQIPPSAVPPGDYNEYLYYRGGLTATPNLGVDIDPVTINSLRTAFQLQRLQERDARGGTRYTEILRSHFGVVSPDARLQRPEYLGGGSSRVIVNPVAQTAATDDTSPQGNLAAFGVVSDHGNGFNYSAVEHGYIISLMSVRADLTYQRGLNKMWARRTRYDFYWPSLAHLGEQAVYNYEIDRGSTQDGAGTNGTGLNSVVFGYQERWAEYRYKPSIITGLFRSRAPQSLDAWHLSQDFAAGSIVLNDSFIQDNPPIDRVISVPSEPHFIADIFVDLKCTRPMPVYGVPGLIDHF